MVAAPLAADPAVRLPSLDAVRGLAFLAVFCSHVRVPGVDGALGVTVFFFLSGLLVTTLLLREEQATGTVSLRGFYRRRALRILPLFYLVLGGCALLTVVGAREAALQPGPLLAQALHGSNYLFAYRGEAGTAIGTDTYWSLAVEEHYYLLFPLLALLAVRRRTRRGVRVAVVVGLCVAVLAWRCVYVVLQDDASRQYLRTYLATDMRVDGILWGAALALVLDRVRAPAAQLRYAVLPAGLALLAAATLPEDPTWVDAAQTTAQALALVLVFVPLVLAPPRVLQARPLVWLGSVSYAAYLLHRVVLEALERVLPERSVVLFVVGLAVTLVGAELCRRLVERPLLRYRTPRVPVRA